jgi:kumamolisin
MSNKENNDSSSVDRVSIPGSERLPLAGARVVSQLDPNEQIEVTVRLRRIASDKLESKIEEMANQLPSERHYLTAEELEVSHGANVDDLAKVKSFANKHGLEVIKSDAAKRAVVLSGTAANMKSAFGVKLERYEYSKGSYRGRTGSVHIPQELASIVEGIFGLDDRPQAEPHFRHLVKAKKKEVQKSARDTTKTFTPTDLAKLYNFPTQLDGSGQCIAIIELGGGYRDSDLATYFSGIGVSSPRISSVPGTRGSDNQPDGDPNGPDGEVMLDIEVAGAIAPGAEIVVYFDKPDDRGFLAAVNRAIHDSIHKPSVISISWGKPEIDWTESNRQAFNRILQDAAALGITVCCASGDNGSSDERPPDEEGIPDNNAHVDSPACLPFALACGGTHLRSSNGAITDEIVWNDRDGGATGGGISDFVIRPSYQTSLSMPSSANGGNFDGRGVPDVSGDASPITGYRVRVDGQDFAIGGTSAVAPLWAGLIALINQSIGARVGFFNTLLYKRLGPSGTLRDITAGSNDLTNVKVRGMDRLVNVNGYTAKRGWDPCTGWGSPDGKKILNALGGQ